MLKQNKPQTGYDKLKPKRIHKERQYLSNLIIPFAKKFSIGERVLKFIIYISLRIVIKPSRWKQPEKNLEIIDRTYKKITSSDFVFIPSSVAFYLLLAFIPLVTIISLATRVSFFDNQEIVSYLHIIFNNFIPGFDSIWKSLASIEPSITSITGFLALVGSSLWISSAGFSRLIYTQSHLYGFKHTNGFWANKIKGLVIVILFSLFLFVVFAINIAFINAIRNSSLSKNDQIVVIDCFLYFGIVFLVFFLYASLFKFVPWHKIKLRSIIPGTVVASIPTIIFIVIFGLLGKYLSYKRFGYIGTFLYIGLLVLEISYFMFVGLIVNVAYYQTFYNKKLKRKRSLFRNK